MKKKQKNSNAVNLGTRGGLKTLSRKGKKHFIEMNRIRWEKVKGETGDKKGRNVAK